MKKRQFFFKEIKNEKEKNLFLNVPTVAINNKLYPRDG